MADACWRYGDEPHQAAAVAMAPPAATLKRPRAEYQRAYLPLPPLILSGFSESFAFRIFGFDLASLHVFPFSLSDLLEEEGEVKHGVHVALRPRDPSPAGDFFIGGLFLLVWGEEMSRMGRRNEATSLNLFFLSFPGSGTESSSEAAEGDDVQDAVVNPYHIDEDGDEDATSDANDFQDRENEYRIDGEAACTSWHKLLSLVVRFFWSWIRQILDFKTKDTSTVLAYGLKQKLYDNWLGICKSSGSSDFGSSMQKFFFSLCKFCCHTYRDILHCNKKPFYLKGNEEDSNIMDAYIIHAVSADILWWSVLIIDHADVISMQVSGWACTLLSTNNSLDFFCYSSVTSIGYAFVYERFDAKSVMDADDARLDYFCKKVFPKLKDSIELYEVSMLAEVNHVMSQLERIVGTVAAKKMSSSEKGIFVFC
ncbi:hypothetical protein GW17_00027982 [Ensete ventricosum]|nr:hypothetical protein GW17_00027982 [Ensete ventricosum]